MRYNAFLSIGLALAMAVSLAGCNNDTAPESAKGPAKPLIIGIQPVDAQTVVRLIPQTAKQPVILAFKSKYCHDCQQLAPHLAALVKANPSVDLLSIDVQYDKAAYGQVIDTFKPATVPTTVWIKAGGAIHNAVVGYQEPAALNAAIHPILSTSSAE